MSCSRPCGWALKYLPLFLKLSEGAVLEVDAGAGPQSGKSILDDKAQGID